MTGPKIHARAPLRISFAGGGSYCGWFLASDGLHPLAEFDLGRDQLSLAKDRFTPYAMPAGYVSDFVFCPPGTSPPPWALGDGTRDISGRGRR
jgi:hypothetical protein